MNALTNGYGNRDEWRARNAREAFPAQLSLSAPLEKTGDRELTALFAGQSAALAGREFSSFSDLGAGLRDVRLPRHPPNRHDYVIVVLDDFVGPCHCFATSPRMRRADDQIFRAPSR
jgi:hypothetical protein